MTSKDVAEKGAPTFSAWVATSAFAKDHPDFLKAFAGAIAKYQDSFASDKGAWGPESENAKLLAKLLGGTPADQASALKNCTRPAGAAVEGLDGASTARGWFIERR